MLTWEVKGWKVGGGGIFSFLLLFLTLSFLNAAFFSFMPRIFGLESVCSTGLDYLFCVVASRKNQLINQSIVDRLTRQSVHQSMGQSINHRALPSSRGSNSFDVAAKPTSYLLGALDPPSL
ncbi:unnamed protein product [Discosporangium mesarthrocarpum]